MSLFGRRIPELNKAAGVQLLRKDKRHLVRGLRSLNLFGILFVGEVLRALAKKCGWMARYYVPLNGPVESGGQAAVLM